MCPYGAGGAIRNSLTQGQLRRLESQAGGPVATANAAQAQQPQPPAQLLPPPPQQQQQGAIAPQPHTHMQQQQPPPIQPQAQHAQGMPHGDPFAQYANHIQDMVGQPGPTFGLMVSDGGHGENRRMLPVPSTLRAISDSIVMADLFVDSMASMMILSFMPPGARVTNASPDFSITQVNGHVPVSAVVDVGIYIELMHPTGRRTWQRFDTRGVLIAPKSGVNLYSTRVFRNQHGARHTFESPMAITFTNGTVPIHDDGSAFIVRVGFGSPALLGHSAMLTYVGYPRPKRLSQCHPVLMVFLALRRLPKSCCGNVWLFRTRKRGAMLCK